MVLNGCKVVARRLFKWFQGSLKVVVKCVENLPLELACRWVPGSRTRWTIFTRPDLPRKQNGLDRR